MPVVFWLSLVSCFISVNYQHVSFVCCLILVCAGSSFVLPLALSPSSVLSLTLLYDSYFWFLLPFSHLFIPEFALCLLCSLPRVLSLSLASFLRDSYFRSPTRSSPSLFCLFLTLSPVLSLFLSHTGWDRVTSMSIFGVLCCTAQRTRAHWLKISLVRPNFLYAIRRTL